MSLNMVYKVSVRSHWDLTLEMWPNTQNGACTRYYRGVTKHTKWRKYAVINWCDQTRRMAHVRGTLEVWSNTQMESICGHEASVTKRAKWSVSWSELEWTCPVTWQRHSVTNRHAIYTVRQRFVFIHATWPEFGSTANLARCEFAANVPDRGRCCCEKSISEILSVLLLDLERLKI